MKIKVMLLLVMVLIFYSGCSPGHNETPGSYAPKVGVETGTAGSIETNNENNASKMEGNFIKKCEYADIEDDDSKYRTKKNEEESTGQAPEPVETSDMDLCVGLAKEIFDATNAEREAIGLEPLIWSDELAEYANIRAEEIITNFSHVRTDGTKCYVLSPLIYGENIARGPHATGTEFLAHWMDSLGHKENILNPEYTTIGVGFSCTEQGDTAVQLFGIN